MALDDILLEAEEKMLKTEEVVQNEFSGVRTGKASASLVENILVEVRLEHAHPRAGRHHHTGAAHVDDHPVGRGHDPAHRKGDPEMQPRPQPAVQGKFIRIVLPDLSTERRLEFVKTVKKMAEDGRVAIRHVRRDALEAVKKETKNGGVSEEQEEVAEREVQKLTDQYIGKIEAHLVHKEKEILTV